MTRYVDRFRAWILKTDDLPAPYILKRLAASVIPTVGASALAVSFSYLFLDSSEPAIEWDTLFDLQSFAGAAEFLFVGVILGPAAETLVMVLLLVVTRTARAPRWLQVLVPVLYMAWRHGRISVLWGFVVVWPFMIYSAALVAWWDISRRRAFGCAFAIHALHNSIAVSFLLGAYRFAS